MATQDDIDRHITRARRHTSNSLTLLRDLFEAEAEEDGDEGLRDWQEEFQRRSQQIAVIKASSKT